MPLLIVIAGPARGRTIAVAGSIDIGRHPENALPISDLALSRRHCVVEACGDDLVIRDTGSRNGVFVNGSPITQRTLADGDQIRIGDTALVAMIPRDAGKSADVPTVTDIPTTAALTVAIDVARRRYSDGDGLGDMSIARELSMLLGLSDALQGADTFDALWRALLTQGPLTARAGSAAILRKGDDDRWHVLAAQPPVEDLPVHAELMARAVHERIALLSVDRASICAPIASDSVLWVSSPPADGFTEDHLATLGAVAAIARLAVDRVAHLQWLHDEHLRLHHASFRHDLIGESPAMQTVYRFIDRVAPTDTTVLLRGESGTGKELIAKAIHANSARGKGPFVAINCAALPEALLESELFGHERGAFTGALSQQRGRFELANGGTVFLDEIGELAPPLQAKLLRALQERVVERVGGRRPIILDIRVVAATNRDLEKAIATGTFRQDLFYRLNVVAIDVPPLRERRDDIPLLAAYFVKEHAARCNRTVRGIAAPARRLLLAYDWPGNVRELSNVIERAVVLGASDLILPDDLPETMIDTAVDESSLRGFHTQVAEARRAIIREALARNHRNVAAAARELNLQVTYLHRLIRNLNLRPSDC